ncbi:response regulator transcription factor [Paenibacillus sp. alder61]|uniref:Response regulator transcription factor n=1 Tax=Paenibacillus faecis TaxID=862114 RepID=A0A5D0CX36_9BACL|nr:MULTISPECIES: response regulator transcription factor [Paenibacillus]MCA1294633.1 response regulator transcription factor [Paenibacillus sp. alder61]TYA13365.1 response regulator transcription factor [Paenibacillus faecis]
MFKIYVVEDDRQLAGLLENYLQRFGYATCTAANFERIKEEFEREAPHLVLLDVNLPKFDGYYWCRQIRNLSTCPIIFISAREGKMDQVMALENGADDYITKPFDYDIVLAKIRSQLRRTYGDYAAAGGDRAVQLEGLKLDKDRLYLSLGDRKVELSLTEVKMLEELMRRGEEVVSRDRLLEKIWDDQVFVDDNTLNVYVTRVRKKLAALGIEEALQTVRGQGYRLVPRWEEAR